MSKRIGVVYFNELKKEELVWALLQIGADPLLMDSGLSIYSTDPEDVSKYISFIEENNATAMLTYDFSPALSDACNSKGIPYISWIYDCPQKALYEDSVKNDCNFIFSFDKSQVSTIKKYGGKNVFYRPLGTNMLKNSGLVINSEDVPRYSCDISFIGNLFSDGLYDLARQVVDDKARQELQDVINSAYGIWDGTDRIHHKLSEHTIEQLKGLNPEAFNENFKMDFDDFFAARLTGYHLAYRERIEMLRRLSAYDIRFYTREENVHIDGVDVMPPLNYMDELPKAYYLSKINLNITLHSITTGIPLRVFDIMGVGGFVLSNYQPDIEEVFDIGQEIEVYKSFEELEDKAGFYLSHDSIRQQIAINGYNKVKDHHDISVLIKDMLLTSGAL